MNTYTIIGTVRKVGSIGTPEAFRKHTLADTSKRAYDVIREAFYQNGYEHVHVTRVENEGQPVDPAAYLN